MKVTVKEAYRPDEGTKWQTVVSQGDQYFTLYERYDKSECLWMAKMFRHALKKHDEALLAKKKKK